MKTDTSKTTILVISMGFLVLYMMFGWQWALIISALIGITSIISAGFSRLIERIWLKTASILGYIIPSVLLAIVFFLVVTPLSLISKLFNKDQLKLSDKYSTYFDDVEKKYDKNSFEKVW